MSENSMWKTLQKQLKIIKAEYAGGLEWQRFEDKFGGGIPDVNICAAGLEMWIELKQLDAWPKRADTLVKVGLRTDQQRWLTRRRAAGGLSFLLAKVGRDYFIFGQNFDWLVDGLTQENFRKLACAQFSSAMQAMEFFTYLPRTTLESYMEAEHE